MACAKSIPMFVNSRILAISVLLYGALKTASSALPTQKHIPKLLESFLFGEHGDCVHSIIGIVGIAIQLVECLAAHFNGDIGKPSLASPSNFMGSNAVMWTVVSGAWLVICVYGEDVCVLTSMVVLILIVTTFGNEFSPGRTTATEPTFTTALTDPIVNTPNAHRQKITLKPFLEDLKTFKYDAQPRLRPRQVRHRSASVPSFPTSKRNQFENQPELPDLPEIVQKTPNDDMRKARRSSVRQFLYDQFHAVQKYVSSQEMVGQTDSNNDNTAKQVVRFHGIHGHPNERSTLLGQMWKLAKGVIIGMVLGGAVCWVVL
ncbi:uncharacterized protein LOC129587840 [Paramacrobiotus metropolitanus]|uniref:uncharacterized protein LOC129587840 n=1 Tax=Paramacrobiotus metropolitanus TaxID=2943436 RepID=UPI0024457C1A|nr:uncharacterized protein LOC129587840 [Paramacrobiotus metropolitanus]